MTNKNLEIGIFKLRSNAKLPFKGTPESVGYDVYPCLDDPLTLDAAERVVVPTGLQFNIPNEYYISIRPRSGLASKKGITVLNTPGTIDPDYRGELKIVLLNTDTFESFEIDNDTRIAQIVVEKKVKFDFIESDTEFTLDTERGSGGFGSSGIKN